MDIVDLMCSPSPSPPSHINPSIGLPELTHVLSPTSPVLLHSPMTENHETDDDGAEIRFPDVLSCDCFPTLDLMQCTVEKWARLPHGREGEWISHYDRALFDAWETSSSGDVGHFYSDVGDHIMEGRDILQSIKDVVTTPCQRCRSGLKYDIGLLYDILVVLIPEIKFYEVVLARK